MHDNVHVAVPVTTAEVVNATIHSSDGGGYSHH